MGMYDYKNSGIMKSEKIIAFFKNAGFFGFSGIVREPDWKGYEIYAPDYESIDGNPPMIGLPYVAMVKGDTIRLSTEQESLDRLADVPDE